MSEVFGYDGASLGQAVIRLGQIPGFVQMADQGGVGMSNVILDDPGSALAIVGWHIFTVDELSETSGDRRLLTAYIGARTYRRGTDPRISLRTGSDREIEMDLSDENEALGFKIITGTDSNRPSETVDARVAWLLGSTYLSGLVYDNGYVASNTTVMDAVDYQGQKPTDVLADCALAAHFTFFAQYLESAGQITLFFFNPLTSALWDSGIALSNDLGDLDLNAIYAGTAGTFQVLEGEELRRDPARVYSGVFLPYKNPPPIYLTDGTIASAFIARDGSAPNSNVTTSAAATVVANNFLTDNASEDDRITLTTQVRDIQANAIKAGQLVSAKITHFPDYTSFSDFRVVQRSIAQSQETDEWYQVNLILSPASVERPFTGDAFAAIMKCSDDGGSIIYTTTGDTPYAGWFPKPKVGPVSIVQSGSPYSQLRTDVAMTVRVQMQAYFAEVFAAGSSITVQVTQNGSVIGSQTMTTVPGGFWNGLFDIDVHNVVAAAGDLFGFLSSVSPDHDPGWADGSVNVTFFQLGRGTFSWNSGHDTWTGP